CVNGSGCRPRVPDCMARLQWPNARCSAWRATCPGFARLRSTTTRQSSRWTADALPPAVTAMRNTVRRALALLDAADRRKVLWVCAAAAAGAIVQTLVILSLMPFIILLTNPDLFESSGPVRRAAGLLGIDTYSTFVVALGAITALVLTLGNLFVAAEHMFTFRFVQRLTQRTAARVLRRVLAQPWEQIGHRHGAALGDVVVNQVPR